MIKLLHLLFEQFSFEDEDELDEANYPEEFDQTIFNSLSLSQKAKYARKFLKYLAKGTSRMVLEIDPETVIKIAMNQAGIAQNRTEADVSRMYSEVVSKVYNSSPTFDWIEVEKARPAKSTDFIQAIGLPSSLFFSYLGSFLDKILNGIKPKFISPAHVAPFEEFAQSNLAISILDVVGNFQLLHEDVIQPSAWGVVNRDGKPHLVLIDYGITEDSFDYYYRGKRNLNRR